MARGIDWTKRQHWQPVRPHRGGRRRDDRRGQRSAARATPRCSSSWCAGLAWLLQRSWWLTSFVAVALLFNHEPGLLAADIDTLSLVFVSTLLSILIGVPLESQPATIRGSMATLRPALDLMQTLPTFVYLIPTLVLLAWACTAADSTVIFALPAAIRLTQLGIASVPRALLEAGEAFGATRWQLLRKVELPSAAPLIWPALPSGIMLSLSMVVIAALVAPVASVCRWCAHSVRCRSAWGSKRDS